MLFGVKDRLKRSHRRCLPGVYKQSIVVHQRRMHLTENPILLKEALLDVTPPDATVLDPFMGSATTAAACRNTDRKFIGIELSPDYFQTAQNRLNIPIN